MTFHPMLPVLLLLALAPLLWRRRAPGVIAWAVLGLLATAVLWPALRLPDGIPSPAAITSGLVPWEGSVSADRGHPVQSDVVYQIQPWMMFARGELRAGRLPFWNPHQYAGAPFWSNGQSAPLFPLHLLFAALPLSAGWLLLPWLRMVIAGLGARALGQRLGLDPSAALLAGAAFPLTGMPMGFWQYPMGNAIALAPWVLWAVDGLCHDAPTGRAAGPQRLLPLAFLVGLQGLAGHPETVLHTALLSALYLLLRGARPIAWGRWLAGWFLGGALAAIQLLPLAAFVFESSRWQAEGGSFTEPLGRLLQQPLRLVLPHLFGDPAEGTWWGPYNVLATGVYAGAAALPLAVAGALARRRERRWLAVTGVLLFGLAAAYHLPGVRHLLSLLPLVGKALHHRLLFAVDLTLVLLLAAGWQDLRSAQRGRGGLIWGGLLALTLVAGAGLLFADDWRRAGLLGEQRWAIGWVLLSVVLVWLLGGCFSALGPWHGKTSWRWLAAALPALLVADLLWAHRSLVPAVSAADFFPRTGALEVLEDEPGRLIATGSALRPNAATVYGLYDLRGDDTLKLAPAQRVQGEILGTASPTYFEPVRRWNAAALDRFAVRWLLTGPGETAPVAGGTAVYVGSDARLYERPTALPPVRWQDDGGGAGVQVVERAPGRWVIDWQSPAPRVLEIAETAAPGWRLEAGSAGELGTSDDYLLAVTLPAGEGRLGLAYRPPGWWPGVGVSGIALGVLGGLWWRRR